MAANNVLFDLEFCNLPAWRQGPEVVDILENSEWDTLQYRLISQWSDIRAATIFSGVIALKERFPLLYYLNHIRQSTSTDPRDKVYATLGMLGFHHGPSGVPVIQLGELIVDYDTPVQDVYSSVVAEIILQTKRLNVLLACSERGPLVNRTWTPDWNTEYKSGFLVYDCGEFDVQDLDDPGGFQSSAQMDCVASFSADRSILTVAGLHWATVKTISPSSDFSSTEQSLSEESSADTGCKNTLLQYCENCWVMLKSGTTSRSEADAFKALWKTLLVDYHGGTDVDWTETAFTSAKNILLQVGVTVSNESITVKDFDTALDALWRTCQKTSDWSHPALFAALNRPFLVWERIFTTSEGFIGKFFDEDIQAGDIVCVILGCPAPLLLRPVGTQFELLGGVYLDGIMFGEAIEAMERGEVELKDFELI
ncbi:hypothetical protein DL95DRAFT_452172 [Leptodontidium sp. 2 PMI_412]|nr:hypothetical protein DL95DRAFT_452172 [Leptodontidium sp. 2 PMI_412]